MADSPKHSTDHTQVDRSDAPADFATLSAAAKLGELGQVPSSQLPTLERAVAICLKAPLENQFAPIILGHVARDVLPSAFEQQSVHDFALGSLCKRCVALDLELKDRYSEKKAHALCATIGQILQTFNEWEWRFRDTFETASRRMSMINRLPAMLPIFDPAAVDYIWNGTPRGQNPARFTETTAIFIDRLATLAVEPDTRLNKSLVAGEYATFLLAKCEAGGRPVDQQIYQRMLSELLLGGSSYAGMLITGDDFRPILRGVSTDRMPEVMEVAFRRNPHCFVQNLIAALKMDWTTAPSEQLDRAMPFSVCVREAENGREAIRLLSHMLDRLDPNSRSKFINGLKKIVEGSPSGVYPCWHAAKSALWQVGEYSTFFKASAREWWSKAKEWLGR